MRLRFCTLVLHLHFAIFPLVHVGRKENDRKRGDATEGTYVSKTLVPLCKLESGGGTREGEGGCESDRGMGIRNDEDRGNCKIQ